MVTLKQETHVGFLVCSLLMIIQDKYRKETSMESLNIAVSQLHLSFFLFPFINPKAKKHVITIGLICQCNQWDSEVKFTVQPIHDYITNTTLSICNTQYQSSLKKVTEDANEVGRNYLLQQPVLQRSWCPFICSFYIQLSTTEEFPLV